MSRFLEYDVGVLSRAYALEDGVTLGFPYVVLQRWRMDDARAAKTPITTSILPGRYAPPSDLPESWKQVVSAGYAALGEAGHDLAWSESKIRVANFDPTTDTLLVQRAEYADQRRSNLILDYRLTGHPTLREMLRSDYGSRLPPLSDARLANTLGVALMVLVRRKGRLHAYCVRRPSRGVAVYQDTWTCTAAGAAKWPGDDPASFYAGIVEDILEELREEVGLQLADLTFFMPVALARELVRGGKPEFFFLAGTNLDEGELRDRRVAARKRAVELTQPVEVASESLLSPAAKFVDLETDQTEFAAREASDQAAQLIIEAQRQVTEIRERSGMI